MQVLNTPHVSLRWDARWVAILYFDYQRSICFSTRGRLYETIQTLYLTNLVQSFRSIFYASPEWSRRSKFSSAHEKYFCESWRTDIMNADATEEVDWEDNLPGAQFLSECDQSIEAEISNVQKTEKVLDMTAEDILALKVGILPENSMVFILLHRAQGGLRDRRARRMKPSEAYESPEVMITRGTVGLCATRRMFASGALYL
ncbi:uncharacterized protein MELLADRAFT_102999 [Melampsora larici-populina 98AG31]|uniref:Uncharacterized protein n=1 Tax=Melampsora larici-populina (strain 98AG31 / pathotype 3-4-7) TaxID=747676 RepID=F4RA82_MELLP|nr:uncharacterized protein MELLADRAFT_102999 [Melampsora larici-populina 98AG31]EGG10824.1 hypothetical protein MELLADRAFT_102999 [Melampsora larici-populina 98AG31]